MIWPSPTPPSASNTTDAACVSPGSHYPMVFGSGITNINFVRARIDADNGNILMCGNFVYNTEFLTIDYPPSSG